MTYDLINQLSALQQPETQAIPVHHVGKGTLDNPEPGSIKHEYNSFLSEVENEMKRYPAHSGAYKQLLHLRGQVLRELGDMDTEHIRLQQEPEAVDPLIQKHQDMSRRSLPYQRGIDPTGKMAR
jgi:hypothetical protein